MTTPRLASWGRYPDFPQVFHAAHWRSQARPLLSHLAQAHGNTLPHGNGRSYGDSCLAASGHLLSTRPLDRFIAADWDRGIIVAETGMTLGELLDQAIPRGWFLPVTPGTQYVTLGGALANDVHGKNHHVRGTLGLHVHRFGLSRSDSEPLTCSPDDNAALFNATIGGLGLTGVVEWVELKLMPISSSRVETRQHRFSSLDGFFDLSARLDASHEYAVAWVDCLASGSSLGRGVYFAGDHASAGGLERDAKHAISVPLTPPWSAVNSITLKAFNAAYYAAHRRDGMHTVDVEPFFYPLDSIGHWNRIYGPRGFQQYQCVIPEGAARDGVHAVLAAIASEGRGSFLAVLKRCGDIESPGLLSFPLPGTSLALDFAQHDELQTKLFPRLDAIVREHGGRLYPAKDAHMSGSDFRAAYPRWTEVEALRDPTLLSKFWQRVTQT
jgi:FAD/FMN-containing dehydrogenase